MDDAFGVRGGQSVGDARRRSRRLCARGSAPWPTRAAQRLAFQQLHDGERLSLLGAIVVDAEDVRMRQGGDGLGLALEAASRAWSWTNCGGRTLIATSRSSRESRGAIDFAHAARAKGADDFVRAQTVSRAKRHTRPIVAAYPQPFTGSD